jgi:hypothetical protein
VVCGWTLGVVAVVVAGRLERPIAIWWAGARPVVRWTAAIAPALVVLAAGLALRAWSTAQWEVPAEWVERHQATSAEIDPGAPTADLRLFDPTLLARWSGALLGASLAAAWWGSPRRAALEVKTWRQRLIHTMVGGAATAGVLSVGRLALQGAGSPAEFVRFGVLLWMLGVGAPSIAEAIHQRASSGRFL